LEKQWAEQKTNTDLVYRLNHGDVGLYLGKTNIPLRAALPSLQGQPVWQPGDIGLNIGEMLHKVKNGKGGRRGVCHDKRHTRVG